MASHNRDAPIGDYDKMSTVDADAVWAFNRRSFAVDIIDTLADADRLEETVSGRSTRSFAGIRDAMRELDAPGLTTVRSFNHLDEDYNA